MNSVLFILFLVVWFFWLGSFQGNLRNEPYSFFFDTPPGPHLHVICEILRSSFFKSTLRLKEKYSLFSTVKKNFVLVNLLLLKWITPHMVFFLKHIQFIREYKSDIWEIGSKYIRRLFVCSHWTFQAKLENINEYIKKPNWKPIIEDIIVIDSTTDVVWWKPKTCFPP